MVEKSLAKILKPITDIFYSEKKSIRYIVILTLLFNLFLLMIPFSIQVFINQLAIQVYQGATLALFVVFSGLVIIVTLLRLAQIEVVERLERRIFVKTALYFGNYFSSMKQKASNRLRPQETFHRFFEVFVLEKAFAKTLVDGIQFIMQFAMGLIIVSFYHQFFLVYSLVLLTALVLAMALISKKIIILGLITSDRKYRFLAWLEQVSFNQELFFSQTGHDLAMAKIERRAESLLSYRDSFFRNYFRQVKWIFLIQIIGGLLFLSLGGFLVFEQFITLGQFVAAEIIVTYLLLALGKLPSLLESIYGAVISTKKLYGKVSEVKALSSGGNQCPGTSHNWNIQNLTVKSSETRCLFENISMTFHAGKHFAILAPASSGKSSFCQLLLRYKDPSEGEILLNDSPLTAFQLRSLHERVCLVTNDIKFFAGSIKENLTFNSHSSDSVVALMKTLGLHDIFLRYKDQLNTALSVHGDPLSENEAKGLMLLRALLQDTGTVIFDDVLDDLDEAIVDKLLAHLRSKGTTVITTTTKDSIAKKMDGIFQWKNARPL